MTLPRQTGNEDDFFHETMALGQEESSFDCARDSHSRRCDCLSNYCAARANARGLLGRDRDLACDAIHSRRDADALGRADCRYRRGASVGALETNYFGSNLVAYAVAIFLVELLSIAFRLEKTAYRYTRITLTIIVLIPRSAPP